MKTLTGQHIALIEEIKNAPRRQGGSVQFLVLNADADRIDLLMDVLNASFQYQTGKKENFYSLEQMLKVGGCEEIITPEGLPCYRFAFTRHELMAMEKVMSLPSAPAYPNVDGNHLHGGIGTVSDGGGMLGLHQRYQREPRRGGR